MTTIPTPVQLRAYRAALGLSRAGLAARIGVSRRTVENWEQGRDGHSPHGLYRAALLREMAEWLEQREEQNNAG